MPGIMVVENCWKVIEFTDDVVRPKDNYEIEASTYSVPIICREYGLITWQVETGSGMPIVRCTCKLCVMPEDND